MQCITILIIILDNNNVKVFYVHMHDLYMCMYIRIPIIINMLNYVYTCIAMINYYIEFVYNKFDIVYTVGMCMYIYM